MSYRRGGVDVEESLAALQQQQEDENFSDDDNAQVVEQQTDEDPLLLAVDDLEGRVVTTLDDVQSHSGTRSDPQVSIHEELATLLRPVLEIAAHTGASIARTYYRGGEGAVDVAVDGVYERIVSDLVLPTLLEIARDTSPTKRAASLEFLKSIFEEWHKNGSWLDNPYGSGHVSQILRKQRQDKKRTRESELLRYWVQASIACTTPGAFTDEQSDSATASRGIIAASASLRPSLRHIVTRIKDADDRGAAQVYKPVMKMVEGVIRKLFSNPTEAVLSACVKFLEIVVLCCSRKPKETSRRQRGQTTNSQGFSLDDLPEGHPIITRTALESIAEYAFTTLRGLTLMGGQAKIDSSVTSTGGNLPSSNVINLLKPAALVYLEMESGWASDDAKASIDVKIDYSKVEFDFKLGQKSYALTVNAMSVLAMNRPVFFKESALCLARRAVSPPQAEDGVLTASASKLIASQLRSSCLTLLRNSLSIPAGASDFLLEALVRLKMEQQAEKALGMAKQAHRLKSAGRAERNRANMHYEWETTANIKSDLADMRKRKAARGLGNGIQLPANMTEAIELVMVNLQHLPSSRPESKSVEAPLDLEGLKDAILSNGASLLQEEGRWYQRGGTASNWNLEREHFFTPNPEFLNTLRDMAGGKDEADEPTTKRRKLLQRQCSLAATDAMDRILASNRKEVQDFGNKVAARLALTLRTLLPRNEKVVGKAHEATKQVGDRKADIDEFIDTNPFVSSCLSVSAERQVENEVSLEERVLVETLLDPAVEEGGYDNTLALLVSMVSQACARAQEKPGDKELQDRATRLASLVENGFVRLPRLTPESVRVMCSVCDVKLIAKKASESSRKTSQESIAASAAIHAAKLAAEKRATSVLLLMRNIALQRDANVRRVAVDCVVEIATGRLPSTLAIQDKALKLTVNVIYSKNEHLAQLVCDAASATLQWAAEYTIERHDEVAKENKTEEAKNESLARNPRIPHSETEKSVIDVLRKPVILYMALCVRQPALIERFFKIGSMNKADTLAKTIRICMPKLARALAAKSGAATVAIDVAAMTSGNETPLLLAFLENLSASPDEELIQACSQIQELRSDPGGKKDSRFVIPVVASMKRSDLIKRLPEFVLADDNVFLAALVKSGEKVAKFALIFRDEPDLENPSLHGMTLCEQLVFLHKLDFAAANIPQKRCLAAITLCLKDGEVFNDRVVMSALDYISGTFLSEKIKLPLAFMRTCIQVFALHETLHPWFASDLLPRLAEGKIYEDARQWEGWMRCAHMLDTDSASIALSRLPPEQLMLYQTKWAGK